MEQMSNVEAMAGTEHDSGWAVGRAWLTSWQLM
jgi:hypothetical protein